MKYQTKAQTIFKWLRNNGIKLGALTDHDARALRAATEIAETWICGDHEHRKLSEVAFHNMVLQMQDTTQFMAFHAIAHCGDWCHRWELWRNAELPKEVLEHVPECKFGPKRSEEPQPSPEPNETYHPNLDGPAEPVGLSMGDQAQLSCGCLAEARSLCPHGNSDLA